jgi:hypothetical protein
MNKVAILYLSFVVMVAGGCEPKKQTLAVPTTYPVAGKVVDKAGAPVTTGSVQFESLATPGQVAIGELQPDGSYSLKTFIDGNKLEGAVKGPQRVTYLPKMTEDQSAAVPVTLTEQFDVKEGANDFTVRLTK